MALTVNGFRTGRAGATDLADTREYIATIQQEERERIKAETMELAQFIADQLGDKYHAWLESTPDGNAEFLAACRAKVAELQSALNPIDEAQTIEREIDKQIDSATVSESHLPTINASGNLQWQGVEFDIPAIAKYTQEYSAGLKSQIDARAENVKALNAQANKNVRLGVNR